MHAYKEQLPVFGQFISVITGCCYSIENVTIILFKNGFRHTYTHKKKMKIRKIEKIFAAAKNTERVFSFRYSEYSEGVPDQWNILEQCAVFFRTCSGCS